MNNLDEAEKQQLIEKINSLLNKPRSDKGKSHKYPATRRPSSPSPMYIYVSVLNRLLKQNAEIWLDDNGYYISKEAAYEALYGAFSDNRTTHYRQVHSAQDLEKYRFNAWQYNAINEPDTLAYSQEHYHRDMLKWAIHCSGLSYEEIDNYFVSKAYTYKSLFCEFYHIREEDISMFNYSLWRDYYDRTPGAELASEFKFIFGLTPGTASFYPEWAYITEEKEEQRKEDEEQKKDKRSWSAKIGHQNRRLKG